MAETGVSAAAKTPWTAIVIAGRWSDAMGLVLCPLLALIFMEGVWRFAGLSDERIYTLLFGFIVTGHHMPGWLRAWGEPAIYRRHKARLWVSALAIPALVIVPAAMGLGILAAAVASIFDLWHTSMQQHGVARIYSGKAGDTNARAARLELACAVVWYTTVVAWSDTWAMGIAGTLHGAGLPVFEYTSIGGWRAARLALLAASLGLLGWYLRHALDLWRTKRIVAVHKHAVHAVMFLVAIYAYRAGSWYRAQAVQNLFHAFQYFFIVWVFGNLSIRRAATVPGTAYRALFGRWWGIGIFAGLVFLYGGASYFLPDVFRPVTTSENRRFELAGAVVAASLLLHFYVDSFIWKVRDRDVRKTLDISGGAAPKDAPQWKGALHAGAYFGIPILLVAIVGATRRTPDPASEERWIMHAADLFPSSGSAVMGRARVEISHGQNAEARASLERAYAVAPTMAGPATTLAELDQLEGVASVAHLRGATRAEPANARLHLAFAVALANGGSLGEAETELRRSAELAPRRPEPHLQLGVLERSEGRFNEALAEFRIADALSPGAPEPKKQIEITLAAQRGDNRPRTGVQ